ncbi:MAG: ArsA family ATPase [Acidimicrobiia bacterium]|nr:ArsA family ATPase [Acidimicrobiia bacterium]
MRVLLFSGKGGVGKTTTAAATAIAAAEQGNAVLALSTDPAHSLGDAFGVELGDAPELVHHDCWGVQIDAQARLEENWTEIQRYLVELLDWSGVGGVRAEELTVVPGLDELFALADIKDYADSGEFDLIVVDCAPTAETIRLLSLPDVLAWAMERIFPAGRRLARLARPVVNRLPNMPNIADDEVFDLVEGLYGRLEGVRELLSDETTSAVRLVMNPERMVIAESRRMYAYLSLFGYRVDSVVVNKVIPGSVTDPYFATWKTRQAEYLEEIEASFAPLDIVQSRLFEEEVCGVDALRRYADELYGSRDPLQLGPSETPLVVAVDGQDYVVSIRLPMVDRSSVDVSRSGDQLFVTVGPYKRILLLPQSLNRREVNHVGMRDEHLEIRFGRADVASA